MIVTVTLNPALDRTLVLNEIFMGEVNRVAVSREDIGGKGINVSKVLKELGMSSKATGFLGGSMETTFREFITNIGVEDNFLKINGTTRTNIKVIDEARKEYTDFNESGPFISEEELKDFYDHFDTIVKAKDIVVLSGGISPGIPKEIYAILTRRSKEIGARVIVDAEGEALIHAISATPFMVKPNDLELAGICGKKTLNEQEIILEGRKLIQSGIEMVLVSRGEDGSILLTEEGAFIAEGLTVPVESTVGAGDAMVAAVAYGLEKAYDPHQMLALAQACGAAAVMVEGTKAPAMKDIDMHIAKALNQITVREYK